MKEAYYAIEMSKTDTKTQYESKIRKFADSLDDKISEIENKINDVKDDARSEYQSRVNDLKNKREELARHLAELETLVEDKWEDARDNFQMRFRKLSKEITDAYEGISSGFAYLFDKITS